MSANFGRAGGAPPMAAGSATAGVTSTSQVPGVTAINNPARPAGLTPSMTGNPVPGVAPFATHFAAPAPQGYTAQPPGNQPLNPQQRNLASTVGGVNFTPVSDAPLPTPLGGPHPLPPPPGPPLPAGFPNPFAITQLQMPAPGGGQAPGAYGAAPAAGMPGGMAPAGTLPAGYGLPPMGGGAPALAQQSYTGPQGNLHGLGNFGPGGASGPLPTPGGSAPPPPMPGPMPAFPANFPMPGMPGAMQGMPGAMPGMPGAMPGMPGAMPGMPGAMPGMPGPMPGAAAPMMPGQGMPIPGAGAPLPTGPAAGAPGGQPNPASDPQLVQKSPYLAELAWHLLNSPHFGPLMGYAWPQVLQRQDIQHKLLHLTVSQILAPDVQGILREVACGQSEHNKFAHAVAGRIKPTLEAVGVLPPGS